MAEAFRERLLNVLSSLKPPPIISLKIPDTVPQTFPTPVPVQIPTSTYFPNVKDTKLSLEWLILATLLAGLGMGLAIATLVWKGEKRSIS